VAADCTRKKSAASRSVIDMLGKDGFILLKALKGKIGDNCRVLKSSIKNGNELYVDVEPSSILEICSYIGLALDLPLVLMFASDERSLENKYGIYYVFAQREEGNLLIVKTSIDPSSMEIRSVCKVIPAASFYEREIKDMFGIYPKGHPDPKRLVMHANWPEGKHPLRRDFDVNCVPPCANEVIEFKRIDGEGVYEIPVGPVHAGIIEPGHFRFSVAGEPIINLEAQLYYVHKGIEKMCEGLSIEKCFYVSERISGDETFTNSLAYCRAVEKIAGISVPVRAKYSRVLFAELERLTSHLGDLGGVCLDTGYGFATYQFRMMRGWAYAVADELCGMRFLRSVNRPGGIRKDFVLGKEASIIKQLKRIKSELIDTDKIIKSNSLFVDRIENAGTLEYEIAKDLNAVGPGGRASGLGFDVRRDFPYEAYENMDFAIPIHHNGDVNCRVNVKIEESFEAIDLMINAIDAMPPGKILEDLPSLKPCSFAFGMTEAPRGENIHFVMTGEKDTIFRYKIRTPSFCNWPALCHAVRGNIVPDFPMINKSFNLSYAGNDL
jgi:Ni,Fe-hydrogenase III large subunit/Ni,Fe-hydrogenase III component G